VAHGLESFGDGGASFAFDLRGGAPWHRLGVAFDGVQPLDVMLAAAHADYEVEKVPLFVLDPRSGVPVVVQGAFATARVNPFSGGYEPLGTVGGRYTVFQNAASLEWALEVVGASNGDAVFDTLGVLDGGRQFFATINLGSLVVDPAGVGDVVGRFLVVRSSHDGSVALTFSNTDVRAVCRNTVILAERSAVRSFRCKHTPNIDDRLNAAREVLRISAAWSVEFSRLAGELLAVPMSPGKLDRVVEAVFDDVPDTDRKRRNRDRQVCELREIYAGPTNVGCVGENGWAAWNAVVEWLDHFRPGSVEERAMTSMDDSSWVTRKKAVAQQVVLSFA
jgi:phage/plasmid-like protein (TIGR03299 family)